MKKSVLAVAVSAAMVMAGAANADVSISGEAALSFDSLNNGKDSWLALSSNTSTLAIKSVEEIEGGMKAIVFYEQTVKADTGSQAAVWDKQSYIKLLGGFGGVTLGRVESPFKKLSRGVDFFGNQVGDSRNLISDKTSNADLRASNSITYTSPDMGGFTADAMYIVEDGNKTKTSGFQLVGNFVMGAITAGVGYQSLGKGFTTTTSGTPAVTTMNGTAETTLRLVGSYTLGDMKFAGLIQSGTALNGKKYSSGTKKTDRTAFGVGGSYKIGAGAAKVQIYNVGESGVKKDGAMEIALGYDHSLSKNTMVYAAYAMTNNDKNAKFSASGAGHGDNSGVDANGKDPSGLSIGTRVKF